jgi:hypothetical protein
MRTCTFQLVRYTCLNGRIFALFSLLLALCSAAPGAAVLRIDS